MNGNIILTNRTIYLIHDQLGIEYMKFSINNGLVEICKKGWGQIGEMRMMGALMNQNIK